MTTQKLSWRFLRASPSQIFWSRFLTHGLTLSLQCVRPVPRLPSPRLLSSPSDISYSQGNSAPGIWAYSIVHRQLPPPVFRRAPRKGPTVHFSGEMRRVLTCPACPVWCHVGTNPSASKMLPVTPSVSSGCPGMDMLLLDPAAHWVSQVCLSCGCWFRHGGFFLFSYFPFWSKVK